MSRRRPLGVLTQGAAQPINPQSTSTIDTTGPTTLNRSKGVRTVASTTDAEAPLPRTGTVHAPRSATTAGTKGAKAKSLTHTSSDQPQVSSKTITQDNEVIQDTTHQDVVSVPPPGIESPGKRSFAESTSGQQELLDESLQHESPRPTHKRIVMGYTRPTHSTRVSDLNRSQSASPTEIVPVPAPTLASVAASLQLQEQADRSRGPVAADATLIATDKLARVAAQAEEAANLLKESLNYVSSNDSAVESKLDSFSRIETILAEHTRLKECAAEVSRRAAHVVNENVRHHERVAITGELAAACKDYPAALMKLEKYNNLLKYVCLMDVIKTITAAATDAKLRTQETLDSPRRSHESAKPAASKSASNRRSSSSSSSSSSNNDGDSTCGNASEDTTATDEMIPSLPPLTLTELDNVTSKEVAELLLAADLDGVRSGLRQSVFVEMVCQLKSTREENARLKRQLIDKDIECERLKADMAARLDEQSKISHLIRNHELGAFEHLMTQMVNPNQTAPPTASPQFQPTTSHVITTAPQTSSSFLRLTASPHKSRGQAIAELGRRVAPPRR